MSFLSSGKIVFNLTIRSTLRKSFVSAVKFSTQSEGKQKLVILGSGWGGYTLLSDIDRKKYDVTIITPRNHFLFTPLLPSTAVGTLEFHSIMEPIHSAGSNDIPHTTIIGNAQEIDPVKKIITCESILSEDALRKELTREVHYDKLVIAVGALNNTYDTPGVYEHAFFLKEISHTKAIREKLLRNFELACEPGLSTEDREKLLHTVIVGGGPTGIEFGAELYDFVTQDVPRYYHGVEDLIRVTIIESSKVLSLFTHDLQQHAEKVLTNRKRYHILKSRVVEVGVDSVKLSTGQEIPCGLVVWSTGVSPQPFIKSLGFPKCRVGRILIDDYLHVEGDTSGNIYAVGDCAVGANVPLPCTAQVAERQGMYLAKKLNAAASNKDNKEPFAFKSQGLMAYIGDKDGVADLPNYKLQGYGTWILGRTAYLTKLQSWGLRHRVAGDWMRTAIFGRSLASM